MAAVRHGDYVAKVRVTPVAETSAHAVHRELDLRAGSEVFGPVPADGLAQARRLHLIGPRHLPAALEL